MAIIKIQQIPLRLAIFVILIINLCSKLKDTAAHVALTYPPARQYELDFLDNSRTKGPCGMPKGKLCSKATYI